MSKFFDALKRKALGTVSEALSPKTSEFWTGPVNLVMGLLSRALSAIFPETVVAEAMDGFTDGAQALYVYAIPRMLSKFVKA